MPERSLSFQFLAMMEQPSSMPVSEYHQRIIEYYRVTENAYKDSWDLDRSLSIHYGYWDKTVTTFRQSLLRMNEVMINAAGITNADHVLDAGCGVGGSSIFIAHSCGARVTGISLSERQVKQAADNADTKGVATLVDFQVADYCHTPFPDGSFDVVWGCESVCYAQDKQQFIQEAYRLLKPGGRLVIADGFVTAFNNNHENVIRKWLDGWQVNYLESPERFQEFMHHAGFENITYRNISPEIYRSSRRLYRFYFLARLYLLWKRITFSNKATLMQKQNIKACKYQYVGLKKRLWQYGLFVGKKV